MEPWADYMADQIDRKGLEEQRFLAKRGDLFIWHALLLHGGSEICRPGLTRKSLVTHFFTQSDCERLGSDLRPSAGGWWMRKPPLEVPHEGTPPTHPDGQRRRPAGASRTSRRRRRTAAPGREPRVRMEALGTALGLTTHAPQALRRPPRQAQASDAPAAPAPLIAEPKTNERGMYVRSTVWRPAGTKTPMQGPVDRHEVGAGRPSTSAVQPLARFWDTTTSDVGIAR